MFTNLYINVTVGTMATILAARVWLLFYDLKHGEAILKHEWWATISDEKDWFIRNKPKWGSFRNFLWKPVLVILLLLYSITIVLGYSPESFALKANFAMLALINTWWILLIVLFCKMPKEYDTLLIRKEINRLVIFYAFSTVWYSVSLQTIDEIYPLGIHWFNSFYTYSFTTIISAMVTLWPHYDKSLQAKRRGSRHSADSMKEPSLSSEVHSTSHHRHKSAIGTTWPIYVNQATDDKHWNKFCI